MGRKKKIANSESAADQSGFLEPTSTLIKFCACCNQEFSKELRKSRRFIVNVPDEAEEKTIAAHQGVEEIFVWKYGPRFAGKISDQISLCPSCGIIVAKLYTAIKYLEDATSEASYLSKLVTTVVAQKELSGNAAVTVDEAEIPATAELPCQETQDHNAAETERNDTGLPGWEAYMEEVRTLRPVKEKTDKSFLCQFCSASFGKQAGLTRHLLLTHEVGDREKNFCCTACGRAYYFRYQLVNHERIHAPERPFPCQLPGCTSKFRSKEGLHAHVQNYHRPNRPFKCSYCAKDFKDKRNHRIHEAFVHKISKESKPEICQFCHQKYRRKSALTYHMANRCSQNPSRKKR